MTTVSNCSVSTSTYFMSGYHRSFRSSALLTFQTDPIVYSSILPVKATVPLPCVTLIAVDELEDHLSQADTDLQEKKQRIATLESQAKQKEVRLIRDIRDNFFSCLIAIAFGTI